MAFMILDFLPQAARLATELPKVIVIEVIDLGVFDGVSDQGGFTSLTRAKEEAVTQ